ncbi:hypothetical protein GR268_46995, partial [Rhizobium leguminosarum]|nr:hypothetical protein [Rhizobium leguminosarum]
ICVVEYITLCGKNIKIEQPHSITSEVVNTFRKHLFQSKLLSDEAEETTPRQLRGEIACATAASQAEEASLASTSTSEQRWRLSALAKGKMVQINSFLFQDTPHYFHLHHYYLTSAHGTHCCWHHSNHPNQYIFILLVKFQA